MKFELSKILNNDFLEKEKGFWSKIKNIFPSFISFLFFFLFFCFRLEKQTNKNVADTTFKATRKSISYCKKRYNGFSKYPSVYCMFLNMAITGNLERFQYFQNIMKNVNFPENEILFIKVEYRFLVESTNIENATFPYQTALSEGNANANRMWSTRCTYHKERSFTINYFIFWNILFPFKNPLWRADLMYQVPKCSYSYFS